MGRVVLDASAVLILIQEEPGHDEVRSALREEDCYISAGNLAEVAAKLQGVLKDLTKTRKLLAIPNLEVIPVTEAHAFEAAELAIIGRSLGLSLGDRLCLATAVLAHAEVLTADQVWSKLGSKGPKIRLAR